MHGDPTTRFTDRAEDYARSRPSYPPQVIDIIRAETRLLPPARVADIGSGTGISSALFLKAGYTVIGIEPNDAMRAVAEQALGAAAVFTSISGTAEATTLPDGDVDLVVSGQAFHWFNRERARREWSRILRPPAWVALMWNTRRSRETPFLRAYEALLDTYALDYRQVDHRHVDATALAAFFGSHSVTHSVPNAQRLDWPGLRGRLLSSSYTPAEGHPRRAPMLEALRRLFDQWEDDGQVTIEYDTEIHIGRLAEAPPAA